MFGPDDAVREIFTVERNLRTMYLCIDPMMCLHHKHLLLLFVFFFNRRPSHASDQVLHRTCLFYRCHVLKYIAICWCTHGDLFSLVSIDMEHRDGRLQN